jgi:hypothetical protein
VSHDQPATDLEERLAIALGQLVENRAPGGIGQGLEHVAHGPSIGKRRLAYQVGRGFAPLKRIADANSRR